MERVARVTGTQLAGAEQLQGQVQRVNASSAAAHTAQEKADRLREAQATRQASRLAGEAAQPASRDDRVARAAESARIQAEGRAQARAAEAHALATNEGGALDRKLQTAADQETARQAQRELVANMRRRADLERAETQEASRDAADKAVARARLRGATSETISDRPESVETVTRGRVQDRELADKLRYETARAEAEALSAGDPRRVAQARAREEEIVLNKVRTAEEQAAAGRQLLGNEQALARVTERNVVAEEVRARTRTPAQEQAHALAMERQRARELRAAEAAAQQAAQRAQEGSFFQRIQQSAARRSGQEDRPATSFPTLRQAATTGLITTARFAASGALLYGTLTTVQQMVRDASELERVFNQIEAQFVATDKAGEFPQFKQAIVALARDTGQAMTEVAFVAFQMQGAFQNSTVAIAQTTAAIRFARVSGLELSEVVDSLTAIAQTYRDVQTQAPLPIEEIGDIALGLQERFGVLAKETIKATADLAPVAREAGLPYRELASIIASIQQVSGRSGTAIAEGLGRVLPGIQEVSAELVSLYARTPALAGQVAEVAQAAGTGASGVILERLIRDFDKLDQTSRNYVVTLLGGRREAQILNGIFGNTSRLIQELDRTESDAGKTTEYFSTLQETLKQRMALLGQVLEDLGQQIFRAGLGDFLKDLAVGGGVALELLAAIAKVMADVNEATGGAAAKVLGLVIAIRLLAALGNLAVGSSVARAVRGIGAEAGSQSAVASQAARDAGSGRLGAFAAGRLAAGGASAARGTTVVGRGALAATGALGINPYVLAAAAVTAAFTTYISQQQELKDGVAAFTEKLQTLDADNIKRARDEGRLKVDFWTNFWVDLPGGPSQNAEELSIDIERGKRSEPRTREFEAASAAGLLNSEKLKNLGVTEQLIKDLIANSRKGEQDAIDEVDSILALIEREPGGEASLDEALSRFNSRASVADFATKVQSGELAQGIDAARSAYQSGAQSAAQYLTALEQAEVGFQRILSEAGKLTDDQAKEFAKRQREKAQFLSERAREEADYELSIDTLGGGGGPKGEAAKLTSLLQSGRLTDPKEAEKAARDLVNAQQQILTDEAQLYDSAAKQLEILEGGFVIHDATRAAVLENAMLNVYTGFRAVIDSVAHAFGNAANTAERVAAIAIAEGVSSMEALRRLLQRKMEELRRFADPSTGLFDAGSADVNQEYNRLETVLNNLPSGEGPPVPGARGKPDAQQLANARRAAAREAEAAAKQAEAEAKAARQAFIAGEQARFALYRAQAEGDPIRQAQIAIEEAQFLKAHAETTAESLNAQAQLVLAQNELARAQLQVGDAYRNIDKAMAAAAGDTVRVAQIELEQAREHLRAARERGDVLGTLEAEAAVITAQAGAVQSQIDAGQRQTDFLLQMEQITTGQAIAQLEGLLKIPGITQEQTQQLLLKIKALRDGASKDVQFDIPSDIRLPTLYEVRRLRQSEAQGGSYQDNRQIMVQYNVLTDQDHQAALDDLLAVTSDQPRVGAVPKGY